MLSWNVTISQKNLKAFLDIVNFPFILEDCIFPICFTNFLYVYFSVEYISP
jgi:hypothetical protein